MRKVREVLRLRFACGQTGAAIGAAVGIAESTVSSYLARARRVGLTWERAESLSDGEVEALLFPPDDDASADATFAPVDFAWVHREMRRVGVTRMLLWSEYAEAAARVPGGAKPFKYSAFCQQYERYRATLKPTMRQTHRPGEKLFIDFSGKRPSIVDPATGEVTPVELYVAVLGASSFTYAEATLTQRLPDFIGATVRALEFIGGAPAVLVPDQLRSAVSAPHRIEPEINATFAEMGKHYGCAIIPARPRKPRDKAAAEVGVLIAQRWILARIRNERFFSLDALNARIRELLERLNTRPFQKKDDCRRTLMETVDRPAMKALPATRFELGEWKLGVGVGIDYCVVFDHRPYSVPSTLMNQRVDVRATTSVVEVFQAGVRVALHARSRGPKGLATIDPQHRPRSHREYGDWPPERILAWALTLGPNVGELVSAMLTQRPHPELSYRSALGVIRMGKTYGNDRLDAACRRALHIGSPSYRSVAGILQRQLDRVAIPAPTMPGPPITNDDVRGGDYFDKEERHDA